MCYDRFMMMPTNSIVAKVLCSIAFTAVQSSTAGSQNLRFQVYKQCSRSYPQLVHEMHTSH